MTVFCFVLKHHCRNLAVCSRAGTSNWGSSSLCLVFPPTLGIFQSLYE